MTQPRLVGITIFPIKSLDGHHLEKAHVLPGAGLADDRRWRLVDMEGRVVNAKRTPLIQAVRADFDLNERLVTLAANGLAAETFSIQPGSHGPCDWLSTALGLRVLLDERGEGFPDDRDAPGPTLAAVATLDRVAGWFGFDLAEARRRFRINLEIDDADAFWEDTLASPAGRAGQGGLPHSITTAGLPADPYADLPPPEPSRFTIGEAAFAATGVCRRCVVPTRSSQSGEPELGFREAFEARRRQSFRGDVDATAWHGFYRLSINTRTTVEEPQEIRVGDHLRIV